MDDYYVKISSTAQNDFMEIAEHLETLPPEEAELCYDNILKKTGILSKSPESCPSARDSQLRLRGYKMLTVDDYIYFFIINARTVEIRRILYARRQYDRLV